MTEKSATLPRRLAPPESSVTQASLRGRTEGIDAKALSQRIAALKLMNLAALRHAWIGVEETTPHLRLSADLLRLGITHRLQEAALGSCPQSTLRRLTAAARNSPSDKQTKAVTAGTTSVPDWRGRTHTIRVLEDGFEYNGQPYASLRRIAREITGAAWSGPRFFGLVKASLAGHASGDAKGA